MYDGKYEAIRSLASFALSTSSLAWSVKYRVPVFFADDRAHGHAVTYQLLTKYWRYHRKESDALD